MRLIGGMDGIDHLRCVIGERVLKLPPCLMNSFMAGGFCVPCILLRGFGRKRILIKESTFYAFQNCQIKCITVSEFICLEFRAPLFSSLVFSFSSMNANGRCARSTMKF